MDGFNNKPLAVLMTTDTVGGVWSYSIELCKSLASFGVHFHLVTTGAPMQVAQREEVGWLKNVTVYETDFMLEWMNDPWKSIDNAALWLLELEKEIQPDLVHLNCYSYGSLPWTAPVITVTHSDVFSWWRAVKKEDPPSEWNEYFKRVQTGLASSNLVIAPSAATMNDVRDIYAIATPGKVVYNGRNSETFYPAVKQPFIFSMGRIWDEAKNIQLLTKAAPSINYPVKLAGDSNFAGNSSDTSGANVSYLGKLSTADVAKQLSAASVYVLPARYEPFGLSALEAALCGCALVLGDIPSLREIWKDSALYVDTNDAGSLADAVNFLMDNESVRMGYVEDAMLQATKYSTEAMAKSYMQVYRQLLPNKKLSLVPVN